MREKWEKEAEERFEKECGIAKGERKPALFLERVKLKLWYRFGYLAACEKGHEEVREKVGKLKEKLGPLVDSFAPQTCKDTLLKQAIAILSELEGGNP